MIKSVFQMFKENSLAKVFLILAIIALVVFIFTFSGGIVTSIFNAGRDLGRAISGAIG